MENPILKLRPHHIVDIIRDYGEDIAFSPHPYGHHNHIIAKKIIGNPYQMVQLVLSADDICAPCIHLTDGQCDDLLIKHPYSTSKQDYNNHLDKAIFNNLSIKIDSKLPVRDYLKLIVLKIEIFDKIYPHSKEIIEMRKKSFVKGYEKLSL